MKSQTRLQRISALLASTSLAVAALSPAGAQSPAPPGVEAAGEADTNPPALVGRLADLTGSVSFHGAQETAWSAATLNYPVTTGEAFWTEPQAQATLEIADSRVVLDSSTELDIGSLDQSQFLATEAQGAVFLQLGSLPQGQSVTFNTPRGAVQITAAGRYEIVAGDTNDATMVTVVDGAAHVSGTNLELDIGPQQTATIGGTDALQGIVGQIQQDAFLQSMLRAPARSQPAQALPSQVRYMSGAADLQTYGSFSQTAQYGQVWYPREVRRDWAPYRDGHWAYVQPWGWTWVDNARWGFAPFHYGRWVQVNDRWGWIAGGGGEAEAGPAYPVYSPALVSFVDVSGAALAGVALGVAASEFSGGYAPAWIPLGPREPYYPWYRARPDYFGRINRPYGVPREIIERGPTYINNVTINRTNIFVNRRGATFVSASAFARGQSLAGLSRPLPPAALEHVRPLVGRMPLAPTAQTPNLSPFAARRYNVALPARPVRAIAAGPRIEMRPDAGVRTRGMPMLRQATLPPGIRGVPAAEVRTGQPGRPLQGGLAGRDAAIGRGGAGLPPLRGAGARPDVNEAGGRPGAGGPRIAPHGPGELPSLRAPGERPDTVPRGPASATPGRDADRPIASSAGRNEATPTAREGARQGAERPARLAPGQRTEPATPGVRPEPRPTGQIETRPPGQAGARPDRLNEARPGSRAEGRPVAPANARPNEIGGARSAGRSEARPAGSDAARLAAPGDARPAVRQGRPAEARPIAPRQPEPPKAREVPHSAPPPARAETRPQPRPAPEHVAPRPMPAPRQAAPRAEPPRPAPHAPPGRPGAPRHEPPKG